MAAQGSLQVVHESVEDVKLSDGCDWVPALIYLALFAFGFFMIVWRKSNFVSKWGIAGFAALYCLTIPPVDWLFLKISALLPLGDDLTNHEHLTLILVLAAAGGFATLIALFCEHAPPIIGGTMLATKFGVPMVVKAAELIFDETFGAHATNTATAEANKWLLEMGVTFLAGIAMWCVSNHCHELLARLCGSLLMSSALCEMVILMAYGFQSSKLEESVEFLKGFNIHQPFPLKVFRKFKSEHADAILKASHAEVGPDGALNMLPSWGNTPEDQQKILAAAKVAAKYKAEYDKAALRESEESACSTVAILFFYSCCLGFFIGSYFLFNDNNKKKHKGSSDDEIQEERAKLMDAEEGRPRGYYE